VVDWITNTMQTLGYFGIGFLMFMENLFPPIPSELIMPLAGFTVSKGEMNFQYAVLAGVVGTLLGALPWYYAGKLLGEQRLRSFFDRYGKWLGLSGEDIDKANHWFHRHGGRAVLLCRLVPGVRTLISLPAGISEMSMAPFLLYSAIGTTLWVSLLTYAGVKLGDHYDLVEHYMGPVSKLVLGGLLMALIAWVLWRQQTLKQK
jgi:membrane protein DedA with SNARE-associated domain